MFYISQNKELFSDGPYATEAEAVEAGKATWPGRVFYVGEREDYVPWQRDHVADILESEANEAYEDLNPDLAEDWPPSVDTESAAYKTANAKISAIMAELCGPCETFKIGCCHAVDPEEPNDR